MSIPALTPWPSTPPADCPLEPSSDITGVAFTGRHAEYTEADTWYPSWVAEGEAYSPWTDGSVNGWACSSLGVLAATGHAKIEGTDPLDLTVTPLGTHFGSPEPYGGRYPCGSLVHDGVWYYGTYCLDESGRGLNWDVLGPFVGFRVSDDLGRTWQDPPTTPAAPLFGESGKQNAKVRFGAPHFVDFGVNLEHSPDGKAYLVGHGARTPYANLSWISGDGAYLCRVTAGPDTMNDPGAYEFFAGRDADGSARWAGSVEAAEPLFEWRDRVGHATMTYVPALRKYVMCCTDGWPTVSTMNSFLLEADDVTGPFRLVAFLEKFGPQAYFLNLPSGWLGSDGRTGWLLYSANYTARAEERFTKRLKGTGLPANPPGSAYAMCLQELRLLGPTR